MKKLSLLFLLTAIFINGCSFIKSNEIKTSAFISESSASDFSTSSTDQKGSSIDNQSTKDGATSSTDMKCDTSGNCEKPNWQDNSKDNFKDNSTDEKNHPNCDSSGKCWDGKEDKTDHSDNGDHKNWNNDKKDQNNATDCSSGGGKDCNNSSFKDSSKYIERFKKEIAMDQKQFDKSKEFLTKESKTADKETKAKIDEYFANHEKYVSLENDLLNAMTANSDMDTIDSLRSSLEDLRMIMDDFWQWYQPKQEQKWAGQMFDDVENGIKMMKEKEYKNMTDDQKAKVDELIKAAESIISDGKAAQDKGDDKAVHDAQDKLNQLMMKAEDLFGRPKPKFESMGFDKQVDTKFTEISADMSYAKQMELVKTILAANPDMIKEILASDPVLAEKTMKILDKVPETMQGDFLKDKNDLSNVYEEILKTNSKIADYKDAILGYNYFGDASKKLIKMLGKVRDGSLSLEDLSSELDALKQDSKESKYTNGIVSFKDYDDSDWYYEPVEGMKNFLKGKEGDRFAGADRITFAETLKITLERFGFGQSQGETSYAGAKNHWAKGYYAKAEELGITLLDPDKLITRGEMAKLIVEATLKTPTSHSSSSFGDVDTSNEYFNYIETLKDYKIVSGDSATGMYRPDDNINRAETAKIVEYAYETLQLQTLDVSKIKELAK